MWLIGSASPAISQGAVTICQGPVPICQGPVPISQGPVPSSQDPVPISQGPVPSSQGPVLICQFPVPTSVLGSNLCKSGRTPDICSDHSRRCPLGSQWHTPSPPGPDCPHTDRSNTGRLGWLGDKDVGDIYTSLWWTGIQHGIVRHINSVMCIRNRV